MWTALPGEPALTGARAKWKRLTRDSAGGEGKKGGKEMKEEK